MPLPAFAPFLGELAGLDAGETEALRLALAIVANRVLMDEKEHRQRAAAVGIRTIGILGVLMAAKRAESIASLKREIAKLRLEAGFFIAKSLEAELLVAAGE